MESEYQGFWGERDEHYPTIIGLTFAVSRHIIEGETYRYSPSLVCAVQAFQAGPFLYLEYLATNPELSLKERHRGVVSLVRAVKAHAAVLGLAPVAFPRDRGLELILAREGFAERPCKVMVKLAGPVKTPG
jgi:hypothetical protein